MGAPCAEMLDYKVPPAEVERRKAAAYNETAIFDTIQTNKAPSGIGENLRPRQEAVHIFPEGLRKRSKAQPPDTASVRPKLREAHGRFKTQLINELRKLGKLDNVETRPKPASSTQVSLAWSTCVILQLGKSEPQKNFGCLGATLTNLPHPLEPDVGTGR